MMKIFGREDQIDNIDTKDLTHLKASGKNKEVIGWLEEAFAKQPFDYWMEQFRINQVPAQKLFRFPDILRDEEAYVNDALRYVEYDEWGKHALPMTPLRFGSAGDPPVILAKPVGYHTKEIMQKYGYTDAEISRIEDEGGVGIYHGELFLTPSLSLSVRKLVKLLALGRTSNPFVSRLPQSKVKAHLRMCLFCSCISVGFLLAIAPDSARVGKPKAAKGHQNSYQENELKFYFCSC